MAGPSTRCTFRPPHDLSHSAFVIPHSSLIMHQGQTLKFVRGDGPPIKAPQFGAVVAALVSGCRFASPDCLLDQLKEKDGEIAESFVFSFDGESTATFEPAFAKETIDVKEIERRFLSDEWCRANPHHPIAFMRCFYDERNRRVAEIKDRPRHEVIEVVNGRKTSRCFIPENATPEERAEILKEFNES